jgi:mRNA interferase MazF
MTDFSFGDIVLVRFPFTNQTAFKQRPAVVISNRTYNQGPLDVIIMAIRSQFRSPFIPGEALIDEWQNAGLLKPSVLKPVIATVEQSAVLKQLGGLQPADMQTLREVIALVIG